MSSDFAAALGQDVRLLGSHKLRGVTRPVDVVEPAEGPLAS
jgi:class 3 adenylate cyclase